MKNRIFKLLCAVLAICTLTSCSLFDTRSETDKKIDEIKLLGESPDDNYRTWYEIFVYSYCDSNGDGIGDINCVISKLDYLSELGINGIWLMPVHPSTTYHKYNVTDYYAIDASYGTLEDFENLVEECHNRDIKLIMDLVINHSGSEHTWFKEATDYLRSLEDGAEPNEADCKYYAYYNFKEGAAASGYSQVNGTSYVYESRFSYDMPDLDLSNANVLAEIKDVIKFWLDKGVDGFRLDAAKEFFYGSTDKNIEVLSWVQKTVTDINEDAYLVAEVWDSFGTVRDYYKSGITSIFNYPFGDASGKIISVIRGAGQPLSVKTYAEALVKADSAYSGSNPEYIDAPFLSNHDVGRIAGFVGGNEYKTKLAGAMNLFMSGSAFVYYGEEIGMTGSGNDPSKRAPMYWNAERDDGTTDIPPDCTLPDEYVFGSLEEQIEDDNSVYNYYRQAIAIRNALPVISHGKPSVEDALNKDCISAHRKTWGEEECIILYNINSEAAEVDMSEYEDWSVAATLSADGTESVKEGSTLKISAFGAVVLVPIN